ncbi:Hypothetical protein NTJ_13969 [Nesidiocoris tenuis]|uniref:Uncharacterized protein n=1 Tax=Nesidiocoris tenuis TaxID=355587 RepID=A0ABN7B9V2_9HEMI|nr:Hypothetical protein NTJ_13969 [Nesidiocoris tenuis]
MSAPASTTTVDGGTRASKNGRRDVSDPLLSQPDYLSKYLRLVTMATNNISVGDPAGECGPCSAIDDFEKPKPKRGRWSSSRKMRMRIFQRDDRQTK